MPLEQPKTPPAKLRMESRRRKLAHLKTLIEYDRKREIESLFRQISDVVGHTIPFSIFSRGLLLAALAQREELLLAAQKISDLGRPHNEDADALQRYEAEIAQLIFRAFDLRKKVPTRGV